VATEQELERLVVRLMGDGSSFERMMNQAEREADHFNRTMKAGNSTLAGMTSNLKGLAAAGTTALAGLGIALGGGAIAVNGVRLAADAEKMESSFKVMLGSASKAKTLMADLQQFAAETPLEMGDLSGFAKMLLQAGVPAKDMTNTLRMLGDVAMGDREKMHGMAYAFQQVRTVGRLTGQELNQFMNAGFNPLQELSRTTGKSMAQLRGEMEKGLISFEMLQGAFRSATGEGGRFAGGMKEASTTLDGLWSTMMDDFNAFQRGIGTRLIEGLRLKELVAAGSKAFQWLTDAADKVWQWLLPVRQAVGSLFAFLAERAQAAWDALVAGAQWALAWVQEATGITFGDMRDAIRDAFLMAEFVLRNFGQVAEVVWAGVKYYAVVALNAILKNLFLILAGPVLLPAYLAMQTNWEEVWRGFQTVVTNFLVWLAVNMTNVAGMIRNALTGKAVDMAVFWNKLKEGFAGTKLSLRGIEIPALQTLEDQLKEEFDAKKGVLAQSWEEFRAMKLDEFARQGVLPDAEKQGEEEGKRYGVGMSKGLKGTEDVLFTSAEALSRRMEQLERMREGRQANGLPGGGAPGSVTGANLTLRQQEQQTDLLKDIRGGIRDIAKKDAAAVEAANL
jgi:tape measure domain-containing protein